VLGDALRATWPGRSIEGVNAAAMSYGSQRVRILVRELLEHEPDALVVDTGHNEFVERRFYAGMLERPAALDPLRRTLYASRVYAAMTRAEERLFRRAPPVVEPGQHSTAELLGLDVERDVERDVDAQERARTIAAFEANLRAIAALARERGVVLVLCTMASNVAGWVPNESTFDEGVDLASRQRALELLAGARDALTQGRAADAAAALEQARTLAPGHAEVEFRLGAAYSALGRWDEARRCFARARDLDARPTRAPGAINEAIRRVAAETGAVLVDVERELEQAAPHGIVGFNLFEDYVHPNPLGHRLTALVLWREFLGRGLLGEKRVAERSAFAAALGASASLDVGGVAERPAVPTGSRVHDMLFNLGVVLENQGLVEQAMEKYRACLEVFPGHYAARENLARLLFQQGDWAQAAAQYRGVLEVQPGRVKALVGLAEALRRLGDPAGATALLEDATRIDPRSAAAWNSLGGTLAQQNRHAEAEAAFRRAAAIDPSDPEARVGLGMSLLYQGRSAESEALFRELLAARPQHLRARNGLAAALTEQGRFDEAERIFRENLAAAPGDPFARGGLELIERRRAGR